MSKGDKRRGNREAKKPKSAKKKIPAPVEFPKGEALIENGNKKKK
jgi:hypothetical protein